ncbi:hypothetical protein A3D62_02810 [Candidatus Kaiserbacteria bacterium RIFCSPHIGHO2_02_FULL_49_11]|uniref:Uncharacterized protein n=1 Tax=Candidatus Kaiserbacteria bacterium RIFCSPHIGHO2_02_FULL_49_11 TaxID=1798489 RepID=A0A1F6D140_9BACT|nr:MAG: hypothetical protein A3D62_02810 [Candidatus Kaiserbacteria bacterium RIFCSPHIGHO2_02_FULL_49_11]
MMVTLGASLEFGVSLRLLSNLLYQKFVNYGNQPPAATKRRSASQKNFLCDFDFARAEFFLPRPRRPALRRRLRQGEGFGGQVKGKQNFSVVSCSFTAGGGFSSFPLGLFYSPNHGFSKITSLSPGVTT